MKKRSLSLALALVICLSLLPMTALAADSDFVIEDGILTKYNGSGGAVVIPNGVTGIGIGAFRWLTNITSVTIPDSVTSIGEDAFFQCQDLTSVKMGNGIKIIGDAAFDMCKNLTSIIIPDSVMFIGRLAFRGSGLTSVTIGKSVISIDEAAFWSCYDLTSVIIPESVTTIGDNAFHFDNNGNNEPLAKITFYGKTGSYAETYAKDNKIPFLPESDATTPPKEDNAPNLNTATSWARDNINEAYTIGLIPSALQSAYTKAATRAEFCSLAVALYETVTGNEIKERTKFDDTSDINVEKMAALGVVNGVGNNKFAPNDPLTREQAATMIARLANVIGKPLEKQASTFNDSSSISSWAIEAVGQMQVTGIMGGVGSNTFAPKADYTREQSIITMLRLYNIVK